MCGGGGTEGAQNKYFILSFIYNKPFFMELRNMIFRPLSPPCFLNTPNILFSAAPVTVHLLIPERGAETD